MFRQQTQIPTTTIQPTKAPSPELKIQKSAAGRKQSAKSASPEPAEQPVASAVVERIDDDTQWIATEKGTWYRIEKVFKNCLDCFVINIAGFMGI